TNAAAAPHALDLYRLTPGVTVGQLLSAVRAGDWDAFAADLADGGPGNGTPNIVSAGHSTTVTGDGLVAGTYAMIDGTPGLNGVPNFLQGYASSLTVTATSTPDDPPTSDGDITITNTAVQLPAAITTGHGTFSVHFDGDHELQLLRLRPGVSVQQAFDYSIARISGDNPAVDPP